MRFRVDNRKIIVPKMPALQLMRSANAFSEKIMFKQKVAHTRSTKESTTRFSPALSNWMVSLLPSMCVTLPLPNFW